MVWSVEVNVSLAAAMSWIMVLVHPLGPGAADCFRPLMVLMKLWMSRNSLVAGPGGWPSKGGRRR